MGDFFQGSELIKLQPGDTNVPFTFSFPSASSSTLNDGALPFNSTVSSVTASVHRGNDNVAITDGDIVHSNTDFSLSSNTVTIPLTYSSSNASGIYHLEINVVASINGATSNLFTKEFDFNRIQLRDV